MHDLRGKERPSLDVLITKVIAFIFAAAILLFLFIGLIETEGFLFRLDWEAFEFFGITTEESYVSLLIVLMGLFLFFMTLHVALLKWWKARKYNDVD